MLTAPLYGETGREAWLRYALGESSARAQYSSLPAYVVSLNNSAVLDSARQEIIRGIRAMLGRTLRARNTLPEESAIILGTVAAVKAVLPSLSFPEMVGEGFWITGKNFGEINHLIIASPDERGVLYGAFALLGKIARAEPIRRGHHNEVQQPYAPVRWVNQWDNLNGTIERGYGGPSIFFENGHVRADLTRVSEYGRLLASIWYKRVHG